MDSKFGITNKDQMVYSSDEANNQHKLVVGKSGKGKTVWSIVQVIQAAIRGEPTIVFNWHNNLNPEMFMPEVYSEYKKHVVKIDVAKEGIAIPLFSPQKNSSGELEKGRYVVQRVTSLLQHSAKLSHTQEAITYEAVRDVYLNHLYEVDGISVVGDWLRCQKKAVANNAASKLRSIYEGNVFIDGNFWKRGKCLYEFDLNGFDYEVQLQIINFMMEYFLQMANKGQYLQSGLNIFLDEAQNMDYTDTSVIFTMLNESRRLNIRLMLAAPSIFAKKGMEIVTQCGICVFFAPLDKERRKIAEIIDPEDANAIVFSLARLKKGEFILCGNYKINGKNMNTPKIVKTIIPRS